MTDSIRIMTWNVHGTFNLNPDFDLEGVSGRYLEGMRESGAQEQAHEPAARARLWEISERLTGLA